jgi:hypothetical protein
MVWQQGDLLVSYWDSPGKSPCLPESGKGSIHKKLVIFRRSCHIKQHIEISMFDGWFHWQKVGPQKGAFGGKMRIYVLEVLLLKKWLDIWQQMKSNWKCQTKAQEMKSEMEVKKMDPLHTAL